MSRAPAILSVIAALAGAAPSPAEPRGPDAARSAVEPHGPLAAPSDESAPPFRAPLPERALAPKAPATRISNLSPTTCLAELRRRALPFQRASAPTPALATPLRITGPLHGVRFVTPGRKSVYGLLDCRLALVLDELAELLLRHGVVEVRVDNLYRPNARLPGRPKQSQHRYGLAADVTAFKLTDGTELVVERDWHGALGGPACGPESNPTELTPATLALRNLVCDIARAGLFHHILTPNFNAAHENHLHLDIKRGERRWIIE